MPTTRTTLTLALPAAALLATALILAPARATPQEKITLMQTLEPWKYPGSTMLGGASMSDGGNPAIPDLKIQAVLTTPDAIPDVIRFYSEKTGEVPARPADARAVTDQDDSRDRPVAVHVLGVHTADASTTIVISRADGEKVTHIAWSHYRRFPLPR